MTIKEVSNHISKTGVLRLSSKSIQNIRETCIVQCTWKTRETENKIYFSSIFDFIRQMCKKL